jgi:hypothetical protein
MALSKKARSKMVRAPGASLSAFQACYGLPRGKYVKWGKVNEVCNIMATRKLSETAALGLAEVTRDQWNAWINAFPEIMDRITLARQKRMAMLEEDMLKDDAKMPQVVSRMFALKNADPTVWQDNPGQTPVAAGLAHNIVVVTGVPEPPKQEPQTIEHSPAKSLPQPREAPVINAPPTEYEASDATAHSPQGE